MRATKTISTVLASSLFTLINAQLAFAQCYINDQEVPCDQISKWFFIIPTLLIILVFVVGIAAFAFWLWMLIDAIKNQEKDKIVWIIIIVFLQILGALIYFFVEKRHRQENTTSLSAPSNTKST